jgi:CheY-like chemotaxis protein
MNGKTILIADDDNRNIFALTAVLKAKGFKVIAVPDMQQVFSTLDADNNINVLLLDMMMPGMDGYEAIPLLKNNERYKHLPVVAVTAQAMQGDRQKCLDAGADEYVSKPIDVDALMAVLGKYI